MSVSSEELNAVKKFLEVFNVDEKVNVDDVANALFSQKQMIDASQSKDYLDQFFKKCERRDPHATKTIQKQTNSVINGSEKMTVLMDFVVRCRQTHLFSSSNNGGSNDETSSNGRTPSKAQSSPFQRRSASRTRVMTTLTGEFNANDSTRSRANSSFTFDDLKYTGGTSSHNLGMERSAVSSRPKSPYQMTSGRTSLQTTPLSASNHLFSSANSYNAPTKFNQKHSNQESSPSIVLRQPHINGIHQDEPYFRTKQSLSSTPIHSRIGGALCETELAVCECLCSALLGIESRLFRSDGNRKMIFTSTVSLTVTHTSVAQRVLLLANCYLFLTHREAYGVKRIEPITEALIAAIRFIIGEYTSDIDELRRTKKLKFIHILPKIDEWQKKLSFLIKCHSFRTLEQIELLESIYLLRCYELLDEKEKYVQDLIFDYTMRIFCKQMMEFIKSGEVSVDKWIIAKNHTTDLLEVKKIPIFMTNQDVRILFEIGKSLPQIKTASYEDLEAIDQSTLIVESKLSPKIILDREIANLLKGLKNVVCGLVMRTVLISGKLKKHLKRATSFFFLENPKFTETLYCYIKEASMGLRIGTAALSKQQVSNAFATAISVTNNFGREGKDFTFDAITSLGNTPNVSSRMQFVQPLHPKYVPTMEAMQPIFSSCDDYYENIFHVVWAIDMCRYSSKETVALIFPMFRFLEKNIALRENALRLLKLISHVFFIINTILEKIRNTMTMQINSQFNRFLAIIDDQCVDIEDVIEEHLKFVKRAAAAVYLTDNELIEQQIAAFLQTSFEAQDFLKEFNEKWEEIIELSNGDMNNLKFRMAETCQNKIVPIRILMDKLNTIQNKLVEEIDHNIVFGNSY